MVPLQVRNSIPLWRNCLHSFLCIFSWSAGTRCVPSGNRNRGESRSLISEAVISNVKAVGFKTKTSCSFLSVTIAWPLHKGISNNGGLKIYLASFICWFAWDPSFYVWKQSATGCTLFNNNTLTHSTKWFAFAWCNSQGRPYLSTFWEFIGFAKQTWFFFHHW